MKVFVTNNDDVVIYGPFHVPHGDKAVIVADEVMAKRFDKLVNGVMEENKDKDAALTLEAAKRAAAANVLAASSQAELDAIIK